MVSTLPPARKTNINNNKRLNKSGFSGISEIIMTPHAKVVKLNSEKKATNLRTIYRMRSFKLIHK